MHELSIAMSILESLEEEVRERGCVGIEAVHVRVGGLSGVVVEALRSAYDLAAEPTPFARSRLEVEEVPIVIYCGFCGRNQTIESAQWLCCPECKTPSAEIVSGRELEICALELST